MSEERTFTKLTSSVKHGNTKDILKNLFSLLEIKARENLLNEPHRIAFLVSDPEVIEVIVYGISEYEIDDLLIVAHYPSVSITYHIYKKDGKVNIDYSTDSCGGKVDS